LAIRGESLEDVESEEESSEGVSFFGPSDNVALVSEPMTGFFAFFFLSFLRGSLSDSEEESEDELEVEEESEEESESESGSGVFRAIEFTEESESLSECEEDVSFSEELPFIVKFFIFFVGLPAELELDDESEEESSSELEFEPEDADLLSVLSFLIFGLSSSELESESDDDSLLDAAFLFNSLTFDFED
jgi:hypothetical protein